AVRWRAKPRRGLPGLWRAFRPGSFAPGARRVPGLRAGGTLARRGKWIRPSSLMGKCSVLVIDRSLYIEGLGAEKLAISGNDASRVLDIITAGVTVTIAGLTITQSAADGDGVGGVYIASGAVSIVHTTIKDNDASTSDNDVFGVFSPSC